MNNYKDKIWPITKIVIFVLTVLATAGLMVKVAGLNMLPMKYMVPITLAVVFLLLVIAALFFGVPKKILDKLHIQRKENTCEKKPVKKYVFRVAAMVLSIAVLVVDVVGLQMVAKFEETMADLLDDEKVKVEEFIIGVYVRASDKAENLEDVKRHDFAYSLAYDRNNTKKAIAVIETELDRTLDKQEYDSVQAVVDAVLAGEKDAFVLSTAYLDILEEQEAYTDISDKIKCVHECVVTVETEVTEREEDSFDITKDPFIVYLSGFDTRKMANRANSDVNILAVVNPSTKQVLLLNTPRDFYIPISVSDEGALDKLTHCGVHGVECSMDTLNEYYDIDIRYYGQVNFNGFVRLVDAIGGITVYSEKEFVSTSEGVLIQQGVNHLDGESALEFVRERKKFGDGDHARGRHQMAVIKGIMERAASGSTLLRNYDEILASMGGYFKSNISQDEISALVKMQLDDMAEWNIQTYAVKGSGRNDYCYSMPGLKTYVMIPDEDTVDHAKTLIQMIYAGETIEEEDLKVPEKDIVETESKN